MILDRRSGHNRCGPEAPDRAANAKKTGMPCPDRYPEGVPGRRKELLAKDQDLARQRDELNTGPQPA
jgi:hypothetical protein